MSGPSPFGNAEQPDNPDNRDGSGEPEGAGRSDAAASARIPTPRSSVEDTGRPLPDHVPEPLVLEHRVLKSLLGAWALAACSAEESVAVEEHLGGCGPCAEEALRLRDAVGLLHAEESLDLDPMLRSRVLEGCLNRRPPASRSPSGPLRTTRRPPASTPCSRTSATPSGTRPYGFAGTRATTGSAARRPSPGCSRT